MNFRELVKLIFENWDKIKLAIEFLKQIGVIGSEGGTITLSAVALADVEEQAVASGLSGEVIDLIKLLLENLDKIAELIKLIRG